MTETKRKEDKRTHIEVPFEAMKDNRLNETARHVLGYIRLCQHKNRFAYPTVETIASNINKSVSQVKKALALLVKTGWIKRSYRKGPHGVSTATVVLSSDWKKNKGKEDGITDDTKLTKEGIIDNTQLVSPTIPSWYHGRYTEKIIKEKENINNNISNFETTEKEQKERETITDQNDQTARELRRLKRLSKTSTPTKSQDPQDRGKSFIGGDGREHPYRGTYYQIQKDNTGTWSLMVKATRKRYSIEDVELTPNLDNEIMFGLRWLIGTGKIPDDMDKMKERLYYAQAKGEWKGEKPLLIKATKYLKALEDGTIGDLIKANKEAIKAREAKEAEETKKAIEEYLKRS